MNNSAQQDEALMDEIVVSILSSVPALASIPPMRALEDDGSEKNQNYALFVRSKLAGKEIAIVCAYDVTVTLERTMRGEANSSDMENTWRQIVSVLKSPPSGLPVYSQLAHLTFDDLEAGSESEAGEDQYSRSTTFRAFMAKA